jgi:hypothetical protein
MTCLFQPGRCHRHQPVQRAPFCSPVPPLTGPVEYTGWSRSYRTPSYTALTGLWQVNASLGMRTIADHGSAAGHRTTLLERRCPSADLRWYCPAHVLGGVGLLAGALRKPRNTFRSPHKCPCMAPAVCGRLPRGAFSAHGVGRDGVPCFCSARSPSSQIASGISRIAQRRSLLTAGTRLSCPRAFKSQAACEGPATG